jgi:hypothetical protein
LVEERIGVVEVQKIAVEVAEIVEVVVDLGNSVEDLK